MRRPRRSLVRVIATVLAMDRRPSASRHGITSFRWYHTCIELPRQRWQSDKRYNPSGSRWTRDVLAVIPAANAAPRGPSPSPGRKTISTSSSEVFRFGGRDRVHLPVPFSSFAGADPLRISGGFAIMPFACVRPGRAADTWLISPGVAQLVGCLLWEQEAASSSLATRTTGAPSPFWGRCSCHLWVEAVLAASSKAGAACFGNSGFALPGAEEAKSLLPQRSKNTSAIHWPMHFSFTARRRGARRPRVRVSPLGPASSRTAYRSRRRFFLNASLTHSVAPPFQIKPASLGFDLVHWQCAIRRTASYHLWVKAVLAASSKAGAA